MTTEAQAQRTAPPRAALAAGDRATRTRQSCDGGRGAQKNLSCRLCRRSACSVNARSWSGRSWGLSLAARPTPCGSGSCQKRRIVGSAVGDRSAQTCQELWRSLPPNYRQRALCYRDLWEAYSIVLPRSRHTPVGQESGQTSLVERINNTRWPRCAHLVRKTLSFSKDPALHALRIRLFIDYRNHPRILKHSARISQNSATTENFYLRFEHYFPRSRPVLKESMINWLMAMLG